MRGKNQAFQTITKSAFFQARKQLSASAFIDLNQQLVDDVYSSEWKPKKWHGFRLCAVDGSKIRLPNEPDVKNHFGVQLGRTEQEPRAMGLASVFYDVLNKIIIDSILTSKSTPERECAAQHMKFSTENDLVLFDRGYFGFWLYAYLMKRNIQFCMRIKSDQQLVVKKFIKSGKKEDIITFSPDRGAIRTCKEKGLSCRPIKLRLVRVELGNEVEVLVTSLMDSHAFDASLFKSLYFLRWGIEENYKRLKLWLEIDNFSGKSVLSIEQDFYAKIVASNLSRLIEIKAQKIVDKRTRRLRGKYQLNYAQAISKMKHRMLLLLTAKKQLNDLIKEMAIYMSQTYEIVRKGRCFIRKLKKEKNSVHYYSYKNAL